MVKWEQFVKRSLASIDEYCIPTLAFNRIIFPEKGDFGNPNPGNDFYRGSWNRERRMAQQENSKKKVKGIRERRRIQSYLKGLFPLSKLADNWYYISFRTCVTMARIVHENYTQVTYMTPVPHINFIRAPGLKYYEMDDSL